MGSFRANLNPKIMLGVLESTSNSKALGTLLFTKYIYALEVAAAILLVAMFAAVALTLRNRKDSKYVSPGDQVRVKSKDRMTLVKMPATVTKEKESLSVAEGKV
jgi:NADH-quinone oxidoreductase subunit J